MQQELNKTTSMNERIALLTIKRLHLPAHTQYTNKDVYDRLKENINVASADSVFKRRFWNTSNREKKGQQWRSGSGYKKNAPVYGRP